MDKYQQTLREEYMDKYQQTLREEYMDKYQQTLREEYMDKYQQTLREEYMDKYLCIVKFLPGNVAVLTSLSFMSACKTLWMPVLFTHPNVSVMHKIRSSHLKSGFITLAFN